MNFGFGGIFGLLVLIRRHLGNYQYSPKPCFEREEAALDRRSGAIACAGLDPLVFPWAAWSRGVAKRTNGVRHDLCRPILETNEFS